MTAVQLKNLFRSTLVVPRTIAQEFIANDAIVDFITQIDTDVIPEWTALLIFQTDGTGAGAYCRWPDTNGAIRFWLTLVDDNEGNEPPTNPLITEDAFWIEASPSDGSALKEWAAGLYSEGLIIVLHDITGSNPWLYKLAEPTRPFLSSNFQTELAAGKWVPLSHTLTEEVDASSAIITLDIKHHSKAVLSLSADIDEAKEWAFDNDSFLKNATIPFTITGLFIQTMPANVKMLLASPVGAWDAGADTWTPTEAGDYVAEFTPVGATKYLTIQGPY